MNNRRRALPAGTADFLGIVLLTMCTGQLVHPQGSLARAALPYVVQLRWGWHRVARALARGQFSRAALFERACTWGMECVPVEAGRLGRAPRTVPALDSSPSARGRSRTPSPGLGTGDCPRAQRAVRANLVAALTSVVLIRGVRVGLVRGTHLAKRSAHAVAALCRARPASPTKRLFRVDAGIAPSRSLPPPPHPRPSSAACADTSRCVGHRPHAARASADARRCTDQWCLRGPSGRQAARTKTGSLWSRSARCGSDGGITCTLRGLTRRSLLWCGSMIRPTSGRC